MITIEQAREVLPRAVETQGRDFVYNRTGPALAVTCLYRPLQREEVESDDDPRLKTGCLIGVALDLLGYTVHHDCAGNVWSLNKEYSLGMETDVVEYFSTAQNEQDGGSTWGEALDAAEEWWKGKCERREAKNGS